MFVVGGELQYCVCVVGGECDFGQLVVLVMIDCYYGIEQFDEMDLVCLFGECWCQCQFGVYQLFMQLGCFFGVCKVIDGIVCGGGIV